DYTIARHYPHLNDVKNKPLAFLEAVMEKQAELVAKWMKVGFVHGVMNTDNVSVSGETIDYGPCAFIDTYDLNTVFSSIDHGGRYAFGRQAAITQWNMARLAETLIPHIHSDVNEAINQATALVNNFPEMYEEKSYHEMGKKLGFLSVSRDEKELINELLALIKEYKVDYTYFFRCLSIGEKDFPVFHEERYVHWEERWLKQLETHHKDKQSMRVFMQRHNPVIIKRNYLIENDNTSTEEYYYV